MSPVVLDNIPFRPELDGLLRRLHVSEGAGDAARVAELAAQAEAVGRPKALCKVAYVESKDDDSVVIGGIRFTSRVLRVNLDAVHRVFAFVATCGMELETWSQSIADPLEQYWADAIRAAALGEAHGALDAHIAERYRPGDTSTMNPGSLSDWPIEQQRPLFELLGRGPDLIGVHLTDSYLMIPRKSVSGVRFPTETRFESCQLCPRENCPGRRAPYDKDLYRRKYSPNRAE